MVQTFVHYSLHFLFPGLVAWLFFRKEWRKAWLILLATMLVDLDHLFAYPHVFVPDRCGIGFHPLHSWWAITVYLGLLVPAPTRLVALGLLMHMATDLQDCWWMERQRTSESLLPQESTHLQLCHNIPVKGRTFDRRSEEGPGVWD